MISLNSFISIYNTLSKPLLVEAYVRKNVQYLSPESKILVCRAISMFNKKLCYGKNKELKLLIPGNNYSFGDLYKGKLLYRREELSIYPSSVHPSSPVDTNFEFYPYGLTKSSNDLGISCKYIFKEKYYTTKHFIKNRFITSNHSTYYSPKEYLGRAFTSNEDFFLENVSFIQDGSLLPLSITFKNSCKDMVGKFIKIMDADLFYRLVPADNIIEVYTSMEEATRA